MTSVPCFSLHLAAWAGHAEVIKLLCDHHAAVNAAAADDMVALHFACQVTNLSHQLVILLFRNAHCPFSHLSKPCTLLAQEQSLEVMSLCLDLRWGVHLDNHCGLGHRSLSSIPVSLTARHKMADMGDSSYLQVSHGAYKTAFADQEASRKLSRNMIPGNLMNSLVLN